MDGENLLRSPGGVCAGDHSDYNISKSRRATPYYKTLTALNESSPERRQPPGLLTRMRLPRLFYNFRTRLLLVMALLLVATLGMQYYLGRIRSRTRAAIIAEQEQALTASIALANESITSTKYMFELEKERGKSLLEKQRGRVINVLIVRDGYGRVEDSLKEDFRPETLDSGEAHYYCISDLDDRQLPKLVDAGEPTEGFKRLRPSMPVTAQPVSGEPRTF